MLDESKFNSRMEQEVYRLLLQKGFPAESILYEPAILPVGKKTRYRPDFLILNPTSGEYLAIIEVRGSHLANIEQAEERLEAYIKALGNPKIATYIITAPDQVPDKLSVFSRSDENEGHDIDAEVFPKFEALNASNLADKKADIKSRTSNASDALETLGIIVATILMLLVFSDFTLSFWDITLLTTERLGLIGAAVAIVIIPYIQKFKGLGIEWEKSNK